MFDILFKHSQFVVLNKHSGVSVHKDDQDVSLLDAVKADLGVDSLYLVHRLDKMTSGILILALNENAASDLSKNFAERRVEKYYLAISGKKPKKKQGLVAGDMERSRRSSWKLISSTNNPAVTQFVSMAGEEGQRLFLCKPYTGKTHQIRVALRSVGSPILGDPIYASSEADRGYLHAYAIRFTLGEEKFSIICDPVKESVFGDHWRSNACKDALVHWQSPWSLSWPVIPNKFIVKS